MPIGRPTARASAALASAVALAALAGCTAPAPGTPGAPAVSTPSPTPTPVHPTDLPAAVPASPGAAATDLPVLPDTRTGAERDKPFTYRGVVLLNRNHGVTQNFEPAVGKGYQLAPEADKAFGTMLNDAKKAGVNIIWRVGYRPYKVQEALSSNPPSQYGDEGDLYVAKPGHSEHQAGLAVDVASKQGYGTRFPETKEFAWLRANSHRYGFILRYPEGKLDITGSRYEPWHYRYVGPTVAAAFGPHSTMTLEEYLGGQ